MFQNRTSPLEALAVFEANITPAAKNPDPASVNNYVWPLSDAAFIAVTNALTIAVQTMQKQVQFEYKMSHNGDILRPAYAPLAYQELLHRIIKMAQLKLDATAIEGTPLHAQFITGFQARAAGYVVQVDTADTDPFLVLTIPKGEKGDVGLTGPIGPMGPGGADGAPGAAGPVGPVGPSGPVGPVGPSGPIGPVGPSGPIGPAGQAGQPGPIGPMGPGGADGAPGAAGPVGPVGPSGPVGPVGPAGPVGPVGPAGPIGPAGQAGQPGPAGPRGATGSGSGGSANPDGGDKIVYIAGCPDPIINFPYCSDSFSFANADLRAAIMAAVINTGNFDAVNDTLVSAVLDFHGVAYGGIVNVSVNTQTGYTGNGSAIASQLVVTDAEDFHSAIPFIVESFGGGPLTVQAYHYSGAVGLKMLPADVAIKLNGQMSAGPIMTGLACHTPPDATDPAWLQVCLKEFVKYRAPLNACAEFTPYTKSFTDQSVDCWQGGHLVYPIGDVNQRYRVDYAGPGMNAAYRNYIYSSTDLNSLTVSVSRSDYYGEAVGHVENCSITVIDGTGVAFELGSFRQDVASGGGGIVTFSFTVPFSRTQPANSRMDVVIRGGDNFALGDVTFG